MPDGNPLVAERQDSTTAYTGIGIAESAMDIYNGVENKSWVEGGLGAVGTGLEALSLAMDPVGTLLQYAVSWLMEHVKPLSDALDWLAGDADQIAAYAATWKNVGKETGAIAQDFWTEVTNGTAGWQGASADAYRTRAQAQQDKIKAAGTGADTIGTVVEVVGVLVGAVREIVRDLVAECVATLIARIPQWVAEIAGTVGIATPHVVASAVALISKWVNRIKDFILKLTRSLEKLKPIMKKLGEIWDAIKKALRSAPDGAPSTPNGPDGLTAPAGSTTPSGASTTPSSSSTPDTPTVSDPNVPKTDADTTSPDTSTTPDGPVRDRFYKGEGDGSADRDPLRRHGAGRDTHPQEWEDSIQRARDAGVEVRFQSGSMAYAPGTMPGNPGQLIIDPDASIGAMRHEMRHLLDDQAQGWGGFRQMYDPQHAYQMEYRAYMEEINYAESIGDHESAAALRAMLEQDRIYYLGE
jgi:hypothetical protein